MSMSQAQVSEIVCEELNVIRTRKAVLKGRKAAEHVTEGGAYNET